MHRLFVAIAPPAETRAALREIMGGVAGARWQSDAQLHLTLRFIGEVDRHTAEEAASALERVAIPGFEVVTAGLGVFDRKGRIDSLWAGVAENSALEALHRKIEHVLVQIGLNPEGRTYKPHITLARFGKQGGACGEFLRQHGGLLLPPFAADRFDLYESTLGSGGADYTIVARYRLDR